MDGKMVRISLAGDVCVTEPVRNAFINGHIEKVIDEGILNQWKAADIRIFNLEGSLCEKKVPILKSGPSLQMPIQAIEGLAQMEPSVVLLANNHVMDYGAIGLRTTTDLLEKKNISYIGTGCNLSAARENSVCILEYDSIRIGILNCAEHEYGIAEENVQGVNPFDPLETLDQLVELRKKSDYLIVCYHGGREHYRYPSPNLRRIFHKMADKGADLVVAQHSHCIGAEEDYKNAKLIYGQGNFIFCRETNEYEKNGMLLTITLRKADGIDSTIDYTPFEMSPEGRIFFPAIEEQERILAEYRERSENLKKDGFVEQNYQKYAQEHGSDIVRVFYSRTIGYRLLRKLGLEKRIAKLYLNRRTLLSMDGYIRCEAHLEMMLQYTKSVLGL